MRERTGSPCALVRGDDVASGRAPRAGEIGLTAGRGRRGEDGAVAGPDAIMGTDADTASVRWVSLGEARVIKK
jgi:hypothetical protein